MLTPTSSRTEYTRGAVVTGMPAFAVVGAAVGPGAVVGPAMLEATGVVDGATLAGGADVVDASLPACRTAATTGRSVSSARDPGATSSTSHVTPATIDPSRTAYDEFSATHCESAALRTACIGQANHSPRWSAKKCTSSGLRMSARSHCRK